MKISDYLAGLMDLFYPRLCAACGKSLSKGERYLCTHCFYELPYNYSEHEDLELLFREICDLERVYALFRYNKESRFREMIYALKYRHKKELGVFLGGLLGEKIKESVRPDAIIPLPLHPRRERERGYNQAVMIARGISGESGVPVLEHIVRRTKNNPSQTGLTLEQRQKNVSDIFVLEEEGTLEGKHILLVDDVITTGATLSSCLLKLNEIPRLRVSVACLARTD